MARKKDEFVPDWFEDALPERSYRSIFKWGNPTKHKHPNKRLYRLMKEKFRLDDSYFTTKGEMGLEEVPEYIPSTLEQHHIDALTEVVGTHNAHTDSYNRLRVAYGKTMGDLLRLRKKIIEHVPDIVLWPENRDQLRAIINYCESNSIALYVYGGGSTVTRGVEAIRHGVTVDMRVYLNKVIAFNEQDMTITVEAGMDGPTLEHLLQNAPDKFNAKRRYTLGHFPQSFEYSVVGGWIVTRGAGQNSTYYGKIEDMVFDQDYVCPRTMDLKTKGFPRKATGPDIDQIMIGSEGSYGILYSATLKVHVFTPSTTRRFSYIFKDWEHAKQAVKDIMQNECGLPSVFRLSDPEETDIALTLYGVGGTFLDTLLEMAGFKRGKRCLLLGTAEGKSSYALLIARNIRSICLRNKAMWTSGYVAKAWEHGRFTDPYLREDLQDHNIVIDTLECATTWSQLEHVYDRVRTYCHNRPETIVMTHMSHFYPQGCNLYFIFIAKMEALEEYKEFQKGILDNIHLSGAAISHHHGIGKSFAPWLQANIGKESLDIFKHLKTFFDPNNILNPGGTLALDLEETEYRLTQDTRN